MGGGEVMVRIAFTTQSLSEVLKNKTEKFRNRKTDDSSKVLYKKIIQL